MFSSEPVTSFGLRPTASIADASSVASRRLRASASRSTPKRNICGVCACQTCSRGERRDGAIALARASACRRPAARAGRRCRRRGRRRSARRSTRRGPGSARRRGRAPSRSAVAPRPAQLGEAAGDGRARASSRRSARARAADRPAGRRRRSKCVVLGRDTTSDPARARAPPASAASVCATSGRPATSTYCLAIAAPARTPLPAHGTSAYRRRTVGGGGRHRRGVDRGGPKDKPQARARGARHLKSPLCFRAACDFLPPSCSSPTSPPASASRCPARPARPTPCCSPASPRRSAPRAKRRRDLHRRARRRAAARRRDPVLRAGAARRRLPRLGDAALRHLLAAPGPDLRAAGDAVAHPAAATSTSC